MPASARECLKGLAGKSRCSFLPKKSSTGSNVVCFSYCNNHFQNDHSYHISVISAANISSGKSRDVQAFLIMSFERRNLGPRAGGRLRPPLSCRYNFTRANSSYKLQTFYELPRRTNNKTTVFHGPFDLHGWFCYGIYHTKRNASCYTVAKPIMQIEGPTEPRRCFVGGTFLKHCRHAHGKNF